MSIVRVRSEKTKQVKVHKQKLIECPVCHEPLWTKEPHVHDVTRTESLPGPLGVLSHPKIDFDKRNIWVKS